MKSLGKWESSSLEETQEFLLKNNLGGFYPGERALKESNVPFWTLSAAMGAMVFAVILTI